jgi:hypothetical protein
MNQEAVLACDCPPSIYYQNLNERAVFEDIGEKSLDLPFQPKIRFWPGRWS